MISPRPYRDRSDWKRLCQLLIEGRRANDGTYYIHVGDFTWWMYHPDLTLWDKRVDLEADFPERIFLWEDGERLAGWSLLPPEGGLIDVFVHPNERGSALEEEMFAWTEGRLRRLEPSLAHISCMWVAENDAVRTGLLARRGYSCSPAFAIYMTCSLSDGMPRPELPSGFTLRHMAGEPEMVLRSTATRAAFKSPLPVEHHRRRYLSFMRSPVYDRERDLIVVAPEGRIAAFCIIWFDDVNRVGLFEPVGAHPDFQGQGIGTALVRFGLAKMRERGMRTAVVCPNGDNPAAIKLYEPAGFRQTFRLLSFSKPC